MGAGADLQMSSGGNCEEHGRGYNGGLGILVCAMRRGLNKMTTKV